MIESPTNVLFEPVSSNDPDATIELDGVDRKPQGQVAGAQAELLLLKPQPITAKLRTAVKHLQARAGFWSRFRGFSLYVVHGLAVSQVANIMMAAFIPRFIAGVVATVAFAHLGMGWTHIVMTEPSPKKWFRRLPSIKLWKKIALPTAILAICQQVTISIPVGFFYAMKLDKLDNKAANEMTPKESKMLVVKMIAIVFLFIFASVAIVIPAQVTLTRVQASMVSEEEETIVPFDRSFDGKVIPEIVGGPGALSMLDAWKTFEWNSRIRVLKLYVKVGAMQLASSFLFILVLVAEIRMIIGEDGMAKLAALLSAAFPQKN